MRISDWSSDVCSSDLDRRIERLREGGIVFHENFEVGRDATLEQLRARHDAILVATGVYKPRAIRAPGIGSAGVVEALDYLIASNRKSYGDAVPAKSEEHTSELQSLMRISYAGFCLKKKKKHKQKK